VTQQPTSDTTAERSVETVFRLESPRIIAAVTRIVRDIGIAEELAQDALVAALEQWPRDGVPDNPGAWLMATAKHRAIDLIRQRRPGVEFSIDRANEEGIPLADEGSSDEPCSDDRPEFVRLAEEVQAAVRRKIDDQTWRTFWEIVVEGRSIRETAQAHGLTYAAAFAAQKRVRKRLQDEGERLLRETARIPLSEATA
jgi:RNA polymerase sigma factor (sigma-70 family)